jgi:hypothetical protein
VLTLVGRPTFVLVEYDVLVGKPVDVVTLVDVGRPGMKIRIVG